MHVLLRGVVVILICLTVSLMLWGLKFSHRTDELKEDHQRLSQDHRIMGEMMMKDHDELRQNLRVVLQKEIENGKKLDILLNIATNVVRDVSVEHH